MTTRFFNTYSGVKPPVKPVGELDEGETANRNTFIRATYDGQDRLVLMEKLTYGEVELSHRYEYSADGSLKRAEITADDDTRVLDF